MPSPRREAVMPPEAILTAPPRLKEKELNLLALATASAVSFACAAAAISSASFAASLVNCASLTTFAGALFFTALPTAALPQWLP
jgi:hypothetical protein